MMTDADRTVLLAMDFQNGIAGDEAFAATGVLERARDAVATAREHDIPVVWVRVALREGQPELAATASFARIAAHGDVDETHASTSIHETLGRRQRSEEHTSELQSRGHLVCCLLLEKKKKYLYR